MTEKQKNRVSTGIVLLSLVLLAAGVLRGENTVVW